MAGPPSPESQHGGSYEVEPLPSQHADEREYQEDVMTQSIPMKTGEEEAPLFDSERPVSAGIAHTGDFDFDGPQSDDEAVITSLSHNAEARLTNVTKEAESKAEGNFVPKPAVPDVPDASESFSFTKARRPSMNFTPIRQAPASYMLPTPRLTGERVARGSSPDALNAKDPNEMAMQDPVQPADTELTDNQRRAEQAPASFQARGGEKKRKKKRLKTNPRPQVISQEAIMVIDDGEVIRDPGAEPGLDGLLQDDAVLHHAEAVDFEQTQNIPDDNTVMGDELQVRDGSPHVQLQDDLEAAAEPQQREVGVPSVYAAQSSQVDAGDMLPPGRSANHDAYDQSPHLQANQQCLAGQTAARVASPSRLQKQKAKSSRRTAPASQAQGTNANNWRLSDYAKLFQLKAEECEAAFASEREALERSIQQALEARAATQSELNSILHEKQQLTATINEQQSKVAVYEAKIKTFKTFVDGVGKDLDSLRKDANALRRRNDDIVAEVESQGARNFAAYEEMDERIKNCKKIKDDALELVRGKDGELHRILLHRDQLQRELDNTVGVLSEERDRCVKLESQLEESEKKLFNLVKSSHDSTLDKLNLIHAAVEDEQSKKDTAEMIEQLRSATQAGGAPQESTMQDIAGIKALIEALDQRFNNNLEAAETAEINTRTYFDDALKGVQVQLADREKLIEGHRETVNSLQEQLDASKVRIAIEEAQKSAAHDQINDLKERNAALQTNICALESKISTAGDPQIRLTETRAELEKTVKELSSSKADLEARVKDLEALTTANTRLEDQLKALQDRLQELQKQDNSVNVSREELERKEQEAEQRRKEMAVHCESVITQVKTKANNDVKKLTSEKARLEKENKSYREELVSLRLQVSQLQIKKPTVSDSLRQELERDKKQILSQKNQIEALQEKVSNLSAQFNAETSRLKQTTEHNAELQRDMNRLNETKEEIELAKNQAHEKLVDLRNDTESEVQVLREELAEAKEKAVQDSAGLERLKQQCKDAIDKANKERDRQIEALQSQLSGSRAELQTKQDEYDVLLNETEQAYKQENQTWERTLAESAAKAKQYEAQILQAQSDHKRKLENLQIKMDKQRASMIEENEELRARLEAAAEKLQTYQRPSSRDSKTSTRLQVPYTNDGIPSTKAPNTDIRFTQPSKPRKLIDRTKSETREVDPIRAPEEIRPDSLRTNSATAQTTVNGPVVEESQFPSNPESMSQPGSQMIAETQLEDTLPTFAALQGKDHSTQALSSFAPSTSDQAYAAYGMERMAERGYPATHVFTAYDQSQQQSDLPQSQHTQPSVTREQSQTSSQEENKKYNFSMPKPAPNSGSRRVPSVPPPSNLVKRREFNQRSGSGRYQTPIFDTAADNAAGTQMSSSHNSSPAFVQQTQSKRRKTYRTPKQVGGKQGTLHTDAGRIADPRLAGRDQLGTKRKLVTEGYEDERKKRLAVSGSSLEKNNRRAHPQHPQSINDLPTLDGQSTSSQTRMQTLAGDTTRATRSTRKLSQNDKMNTRFRQALNRR